MKKIKLVQAPTVSSHMVSWLFLCSLLCGVDCLNNGLALTPPMGWMHWERFRCLTNCTLYPHDCLTEGLIRSQADAMVTDGFRDVGYEYVSIDDCWMAHERDSNGFLVPDPKRFPSGIKALADYIHSKGLKLGIYADVGTQTCQKYPGSEGHLQQDAETFAKWGVDLLKLDGCNSYTWVFMREKYENMGKYLNATGRPILYLCSWPAYVNKNPFLTDYSAFRRTCNQWRNFDDIQDSWDSLYSIITYYGDNTYNMSRYAGSGGWNDPDELIIGNFGLSVEQERVQMGMWAMMASPLFMSLDLRKVRPESRLLLKNRTLIAINQDPLGIQGRRIWKKKYGLKYIEGWAKPLQKKGSVAIAIINSDAEGAPVMLKQTLSDFGLGPFKYSISDVLYVENNQHLGSYMNNDTIVFQVNPTGIYLGIVRTVSEVSSENFPYISNFMENT